MMLTDSIPSSYSTIIVCTATAVVKDKKSFQTPNRLNESSRCVDGRKAATNVECILSLDTSQQNRRSSIDDIILRLVECVRFFLLILHLIIPLRRIIRSA